MGDEGRPTSAYQVEGACVNGTAQVLDNRLSIHLDLDIPVKANTLFQTNPMNRGHLANQLLTYDQLVIPTKDFGILPVLLNWMGERCFVQAMDAGAFKFVHRNSVLAYLGDGTGLSELVIQVHASATRTSWSTQAAWSVSSDAVDLQLRHMCPSLTASLRSRIAHDVIQHTSELDFDRESFLTQVVRESYLDIMNNRDLQSFVAAQDTSNSNDVNLRRLAGIQPNHHRVLGLDGVKDPIDLVLRIGEINTEVATAWRCGVANLHTSAGAERLVAGKLDRAGLKPSLQSRLLDLMELAQVPDIGCAVAAGDLSVADIWKVRERKAAKSFRRWLHSRDTCDPREIERQFVASLRGQSIAASLPQRVLRAVAISSASTLAGLALGPIAGTAIGLAATAGDIFFVEKWLAGFSPRLFLDELTALPINGPTRDHSARKEPRSDS